jgi:hypothetical protein
MDRVQTLPRTKDFSKRERPQTSIEDMRKELGADFTDEELLLLLLVSDDDIKAMRAAGPINTAYSGEGKSLSAFIKELTKLEKQKVISIQRDNLSLTLKKHT